MNSFGFPCYKPYSYTFSRIVRDYLYSGIAALVGSEAKITSLNYVTHEDRSSGSRRVRALISARRCALHPCHPGSINRTQDMIGRITSLQLQVSSQIWIQGFW
jgi:hypothetical protein